MLVLEVSCDCIQFGVKSSDFTEYSILSITEFQQLSQLPKHITPKPMIIWERVNSHRKSENVIWNTIIESFLRFHFFRVKSSYFLDYSNLLRAEFHQSGQLQNCILLNRLLYQGVQINVRNLRKSYLTVVFNLWSDFPPNSSIFDIFWLLFTVMSELTSVTEFFFGGC
jgi:hypothetical protein